MLQLASSVPTVPLHSDRHFAPVWLGPLVWKTRSPVVSFSFRVFFADTRINATMPSTDSRFAGRLLVLCSLLAGILPAQNSPAASADFFETKVRPVLANNCFNCHGSSQLGGLRMDSREGILK